jgi:hypothetical protein
VGCFPQPQNHYTMENAYLSTIQISQAFRPIFVQVAQKLYGCSHYNRSCKHVLLFGAVVEYNS